MTKVSPGPLPSAASLELPEPLSYRIKRRLLGPPLTSEELGGQRLGKPTALAVLSSDVMSSSAYATEEMLRILLPAAGVAAFTLVSPITLLILVVLAFVTACYRQVVKAYPVTGGSYVVTRENFGLGPAQVPAAALLISYTITVAVSVAAGADAIISAIPGLSNGDALWLSIVFVVLLAYGNLRGIREAGSIFAVPTYFFILNMYVLIAYGLIQGGLGHLGRRSLHVAGLVPVGHAGGGLLLGAGLFFFLQSFANGGSALTGTEAISNAVTVFKDPQPRNARTTLVLMSVILGSLFLGVSVLAAFTHAAPFQSGTPTVLSEIGKAVYGVGLPGSIAYFCLQASTALILVLAANTSFNGFPFLVSFVAEDSYLPRQLTRRGHRLVFSNGIILLTVASVVLLLATRAQVSVLIPLYAISVFTGFTMAGAGMTKYHLGRRGQPGWRRNAAINGAAGVVCLIVVVIFAVTEFTRGAWVVVVAVPLIVYGLNRTHRQYRSEAARLERGVSLAAEAPVLRRHMVLVLVDRLDLAAARAIQYARTLSPDELRAVHFVLDDQVAKRLKDGWARLGLTRLPLEVVECPDRRLRRAALEVVAQALADGQTEVSVLLPRRIYPRAWSRVLHDRTADGIAAEVGQLAHANATIVPFQVGRSRSPRRVASPTADDGGATAMLARHGRNGAGGDGAGGHLRDAVPGTVPIGEVHWRQRAKVAGRVKAVEVQPWGDVARLTVTVVDASGGLTLIFGRRDVPGITTGVRLVAEGMVSELGGRLAIYNPIYRFLPAEGEPVGEDV